MKTILTLGSFLFLLALTASGQSVVGIWTTTISTGNSGITTTICIEMKADSTFTFDEDNDGTPEGSSTYLIDGHQINFSINDDFCTGKSVCEFEFRDDGKTLFIKPVRIDCENVDLPPPLTLSRRDTIPK